VPPQSSARLAAVSRVAAAPPVPRPGAPVPASAPALNAAPAEVGAEPARSRRGPAACSALRASLAISCAEGAAAELFAACAGGAALTAWALHLGATPVVFGVLAALPLAAQVLQIPAAWLTLALGAKPVALVAIGASRLVWLLMVAAPFLTLSPDGQLAMFLGVVALGGVLAVVGNNAWMAWMAGLVPRAIRGRFFGRRTLYITAAGSVATVVIGLVLDRAAAAGAQPATLAGLAAVAAVAGLISVELLRRQHDPGRGESHPWPSWRTLIQVLADARGRPFLLYQLAWNAAVALAAGFFSVHLVTNLAAGFMIVAAHGVLVALVRIAAAPLWGHAVDRFGGRPVLIVCSAGIAVVPALWLLVTPTFLWPLALEAVLAGGLWAGHGIATMELTVRLAARPERPLYLAAFAAAGGAGFALTSLAAGWAASQLPPHLDVFGWTWTNLHVLFLLSAAARAASAGLAVRIEDRGAARVRDLLAAAFTAGSSRVPDRGVA
jgi:hypothetical protein